MAPKSVQELLETANSGNYFSFTVVRHPFDRLVSAYRDRILHGCTDQAKYHIPQIFSLTRRRLILLGRENQVMEFLGFIKLVKINLMKLFFNIHIPLLIRLHNRGMMSIGSYSKGWKFSKTVNDGIYYIFTSKLEWLIILIY